MGEKKSVVDESSLSCFFPLPESHLFPREHFIQRPDLCST